MSFRRFFKNSFFKPDLGETKKSSHKSAGRVLRDFWAVFWGRNQFSLPPFRRAVRVDGGEGRGRCGLGNPAAVAAHGVLSGKTPVKQRML